MMHGQKNIKPYQLSKRFTYFHTMTVPQLYIQSVQHTTFAWSNCWYTRKISGSISSLSLGLWIEQHHTLLLSEIAMKPLLRQ